MIFSPTDFTRQFLSAGSHGNVSVVLRIIKENPRRYQRVSKKVTEQWVLTDKKGTFSGRGEMAWTPLAPGQQFHQIIYRL